jgi:hypothetical protein
MIDNRDTQVDALIEVFELYMLRDADLADMREPVAVATRAMLDAGLTSGMVLHVIDGAVQVASMAATAVGSGEPTRELRALVGPWVMAAYFDSGRPGGGAPLAA